VTSAAAQYASGCGATSGDPEEPRLFVGKEWGWGRTVDFTRVFHRARRDGS
jgi:hypothetical protein